MAPADMTQGLAPGVGAAPLADGEAGSRDAGAGESVVDLAGEAADADGPGERVAVPGGDAARPEGVGRVEVPALRRVVRRRLAEGERRRDAGSHDGERLALRVQARVVDRAVHPRGGHQLSMPVRHEHGDRPRCVRDDVGDDLLRERELHESVCSGAVTESCAVTSGIASAPEPSAAGSDGAAAPPPMSALRRASSLSTAALEARSASSLSIALWPEIWSVSVPSAIRSLIAPARASSFLRFSRARSIAWVASAAPSPIPVVISPTCADALAAWYSAFSVSFSVAKLRIRSSSCADCARMVSPRLSSSARWAFVESRFAWMPTL